MLLPKVLLNSTKNLKASTSFVKLFLRSISTTHSKMSEVDKRFTLPQRYAGTKESVWTEYIQMAIDYKPLNLGQGFPDYPPPQYIMDTLSNVAIGEDYMLHQYTRGFVPGKDLLILHKGRNAYIAKFNSLVYNNSRSLIASHLNKNGRLVSYNGGNRKLPMCHQ